MSVMAMLRQLLWDTSLPEETKGIEHLFQATMHLGLIFLSKFLDGSRLIRSRAGIRFLYAQFVAHPIVERSVDVTLKAIA